MIPILTLAAAVLVLAFFVAVVPAWRYWIPSWEIGPPTPSIPSPAGSSRHAVIVPIVRIRVVDIQRVRLEQLLKLATVTVTTASSAGTIRIAGLDAAAAAQVAADLTIATEAHR